jgi:hypothetical protein
MTGRWIDIGDESMREILLLEEQHGYRFVLEGDGIHFRCTKDGIVIDQIKPLIDAVRANREEAVRFLQKRTGPLCIAELLYEAAEKAEKSARRYESIGKLEMARAEWKRFARLMAASLQEAGVSDPFIPWDEWIRSFDEELFIANPKR